MIDDANNELYAEFFPSETTAGCLHVLRFVIEKCGVFKTLYVDRERDDTCKRSPQYMAKGKDEHYSAKNKQVISKVIRILKV